MKNSKRTAKAIKVKTRNRASFVVFEKKNCYHRLLLNSVIGAAEQQKEHNKEMEEKFAKDQQFERALMQQQFGHGIEFVLSMIQHFNKMWDATENPPIALVYSHHWANAVQAAGCTMDPKLEKAFEAFKAELVK